MLDGPGDNLTSHGPVVILHLFDFDAALAHPDPAFQAGIATAAVTGEGLDAIESGDDAAPDAVGVEDLIALERPVDINQHSFQAFDLKAGQAVTQHVVAEGAAGADPALQGRLGEFALQLLKAG